MIDKDCSSSLIFGIVGQLDWGSVLLTGNPKFVKHEDPSNLKMKGENSDWCWFEKIPSFV